MMYTLGEYRQTKATVAFIEVATHNVVIWVWKQPNRLSPWNNPRHSPKKRTQKYWINISCNGRFELMAQTHHQFQFKLTPLHWMFCIISNPLNVACHLHPLGITQLFFYHNYFNCSVMTTIQLNFKWWLLSLTLNDQTNWKIFHKKYYNFVFSIILLECYATFSVFYALTFSVISSPWQSIMLYILHYFISFQVVKTNYKYIKKQIYSKECFVIVLD